MYYLLLAYSFLAVASGSLYEIKRANVKDFPFQVSMGAETSAIISENWIITADRTDSPELDHDPENYIVRAGVNWSTTTDPFMVGSPHQVEKIIAYKDEKNLTGPAPLSKIVLLKVKEPFKFDDLRQQIQLFSEGEKLVPGTLANVTGYRLFYVPYTDWMYEIQYAQVPIMDTDLCNKTHRANAWKDDADFGMLTGIPEGYMCADYSNNTSHKNVFYHSGGFVTVNNRLAGILGDIVGTQPLFQNPKPFIEVAKFRKWIDQNVDQPLL